MRIIGALEHSRRYFLREMFNTGSLYDSEGSYFC